MSKKQKENGKKNKGNTAQGNNPGVDEIDVNENVVAENDEDAISTNVRADPPPGPEDVDQG
jgi:hypothetical protein